MQHELVRTSHTDAWFTYLLPTLYVFFIGYVFTQMARRFPGKHMFEISRMVCGAWLGTLINLILIFHLWLILMRDLRSFGKFIGTILLPNTPQEILVLLFMLLLMFYGKSSVEVVARVNDLFFPLFVGLAVLQPIMLANELDTRLIQPFLTTTPVKVFYGNLLCLGWYGDIFVTGAFLHTIWSAKQIHSAIRHGTVLATIILTLYLFLEVMVLGPVIPANMLYPAYSLVQHIHITDFLDRVDLIMLSIWYPVTACKIILIYLAFLTGIAHLIGKRDYTTINSPISLLLLLTTLFAFSSTTDVFSFGNYSSPVIVLAYQPVLFLLLLLLVLRHPVVRDKNMPGESGSPAGGGRPNNKAGPDQGKHRAWVRLGNVLLLTACLFVAAGLMYSNRYAVIGVIAAAGYGTCLLLAAGSSHMEIRRAKKHTVKGSSGAA
ncbi:endospore germination permease [Paenibacillus sp. P26]|nr:endospore germination permease [Paenibacillus sp. P26]